MSENVTKAFPASWEMVPIKNVASLKKGRRPKDLGGLTETRDIPYIDIKAFEISYLLS